MIKAPWISLVLMSLAGGAFAQSAADALPTGGRVVAGQAIINHTGNTMNVVQASQRAVVNWDSFNIGKNAKVEIVQPNSQAVIHHRVNSVSATQIDGMLKSNGQVVISNSKGVSFGTSAQIDVGSIVATTMDINDKDFMEGKSTFKGNGTGAVVNHGKIQTKDPKGYIALLAPEVRNEGYILAKGGAANVVALASGSQVTLDFRGDQLMTVKVDASAYKSLIENKRVVQVDGGMVVIAANSAAQLMGSVIKNSGRISTSSMVNNGGVIEILADTVQNLGAIIANATGNTGNGGQINIKGNNIALADSSKIKANAKEQGNGGQIIVLSEKKTQVSGVLEAKGGKTSGNGGFIDTSSKEVLEISSKTKVDTSARNILGKAGTWLLDPMDLLITTGFAQVISDALQNNNVTVQVQGNVCSGGSCTQNGSGNLTIDQGVTISKTGGVKTVLTFLADGTFFNYGTINQAADSILEVVIQAQNVNLAQNSKIEVNKVTITAVNSVTGYGSIIGAGANPLVNILANIFNFHGAITVNSRAQVTVNGVTSNSATVGTIRITADELTLASSGKLEANGDINGGTIILSANGTGIITIEGLIQTNGGNGRGGEINISQAEDIHINNAIIQSNGNNGGYINIFTNSGDLILQNALIQTNGSNGRGGSIGISATNNTLISDSNIEAKGLNQGGIILIGNDADNGTLPFSVSVTLDNANIDVSGQNNLNNQDINQIKIDTQNDLLINNSSLKANGEQGGQIYLNSQYQDIVFDNSVIQTNGSNGRGGTVEISSNSGSLTINSTIQATGATVGGTVLLTADHILLDSNTLINVTGNSGGGSVLVGGDWQGSGTLHQSITVTMNQGVIIDASAIQNGNGGTVVLWSDVTNQNSVTTAKGTIFAKGGLTAGDGGQIETSGYNLNVDGASISTAAPNGQIGQWLLDPRNITISSGSNSGVSSYTATADSAVINVTTLNTALASTNVTVFTGSTGNSQAGNITVSSAITAGGTGTLTLQAAGNIVINADITRTSTGGLILRSGSGSVSGTGKLNLSGGTTLELSHGITVSNDIVVGSGGVTIKIFQQLDVQVLIVAGGGAGGGRGWAGGGGGGGVIYGNTALSSGTTAITVGSGGSGEFNSTGLGNNGADSQFGTVTAIGGGGGSGYGYGNDSVAASGRAGGSGGGAGEDSLLNQMQGGAASTQTVPSSAWQAYGNVGGSGSGVALQAGGGGGGAGSAGGGISVYRNPGNGGSGIAFDISGSSRTYGGGGGGATCSSCGTQGSGGSGGGGAGGDATGVSGTAGLGGGGGGSQGASNASGGSGVVVVAYAGTSSMATGGVVTTSGNKTIHTFSTTGSSSFVINGSFSASLTGAISGTGSLTIDATGGSLTLSGNNSYGGSTTISAGTLRTGSTTALPSTTALTVNTGATLDMWGHSISIGSLSGAGTIISSRTPVGDQTGLLVYLDAANSSSYSGLGTVWTNLVNSSLNATIVGSPTFNSSGGYFTLNGTSQYFNLGSSSSLLLNGTSSFTFNLWVSLPSPTANQVLISRHNGSVEGDYVYKVLSSGKTGAYREISPWGFDSTGTVPVSNLSQLTMTYNGSVLTSYINGVSQGSMTLGSVSGGGGATMETLIGAAKYNSAVNEFLKGDLYAVQVYNKALTATQIQETSAGAKLTVGGSNADTTFSGVISSAGKQINLTKAGTGTLTMSGNSTYTGLTTVSAGTLKFAPSSSFSMTLSGGITNNSEVLYEAASGSALFLDGAVSGAGTWTINSASSNTTFNNRMIFRGTSTVSGQMTVTNYGNLWLEGSSVNATSAINLNGANTYLRVYGAAGATIKSGTITGNGTIDFASGGGGKALTLSVGNDNGTGSFAGTIVNSASSDGPTVLSVAKVGSGTWTLTGANTYSGTTLVSSGTLAIGVLGSSAATLGSGASYSQSITVSSGATFSWLSSANQTFSNFAAGTGTINLGASAGTVTISGDQAFTGTINVAQNVTMTAGTNNAAAGLGNATAININNGGTITLATTANSNGFIGNGVRSGLTLTINSGGTLTSAASSSTTFHLKLGSFVLAGGTLGWGGTTSQWGSWNLGTDITVTENSTVSATGLTLTKSGGTSINVAAGKTLTLSGTLVSTTEAASCSCDSNSLNINTSGVTGTVLLSGANTYKGGTTITAGTVKIGHATALGASTGGVTLSSGAVLDLNGITMTNTNALSLSGTGISSGGSLINSSSTAATYAGNVTMGSAVIMNTASGLTLSGAVTGGTTTNTLLLKGGGNFTLNNASNVISTFAGQVGSLTLKSDNLLIGTASSVSGLSATGGVTVNVTGDIVTNSAVAYSGSTSGTLSFTAGDDIFINSTIATSDGALGVQLTAGASTGYIGIENNITTRGGAVVMTAPTIALQQNAFTINTTAPSGTGGAVTFTGPVLLAASSADITINTGGGNISFSSTIDSASSYLRQADLFTDIVTTTDGWNSASTNTSSAWGTILGLYTVGPLTRTFNLGGAARTITFDFYRVDSWDSEYFDITIGSCIFRAQLRCCQTAEADNMLSAASQTVGSYTTTIASQGMASSSVNNAAWGDQKYLITIAAPSSSSNQTISLSSTLDSANTDEAWGARNFTVSAANTVFMANASGLNINAGTGNVTFTGAVGANKVAGNIAALGATVNAAAINIYDGGSLSITNSSSSALTGVISGAITFNKAGAGNLTLSGSSTFTAGTTITAGTLTLDQSSSTTGTVLADTGAITVNGGSLVLNDLTETVGQVTLTSGSITVGATGNTLTGTSYVLNPSTGTDHSITAVLAGTSVTLTKSGNGTVTLSGSNTYTGATTLSGGTLSVSTLASGGNNSNIGKSTNVAGNLVFNGGTLAYTGSAVSIDRLFTISNNGGTIDVSGAGALNFTNTGSIAYSGTTAARTFTLTGANTGDNKISAVLANNTGATSLTKSGAGTWWLSGANTFTGGVTISAGTLKLGNAAGLGGSTSAASVTDGAVLDLNGQTVTNTNALTLNGTGISSGGALINSSTSA
ncbi:beta strand repeat-containing protein, partial [Polynucleobacter cosmopolitanus]